MELKNTFLGLEVEMKRKRLNKRQRCNFHEPSKEGIRYD